MTNWYFNMLFIRGEDKDVQAVAEQLATTFTPGRKSVFSLSNIIAPVGIEPENLLELYDWSLELYDWSLENWGTISDANEPEMSPAYNGRVSYYFLTASTPPIAAIATLAKQWPSLRVTLKYSEDEIDLEGKNVWEHGVSTSEVVGICSKRWCYVCEDYYILPEITDVDPGCTYWSQAMNGSHVDRVHLINHPGVTPDGVMLVLHETMAAITELNGDELLIAREQQIFLTASNYLDLSGEATLLLHGLGVEAVSENMFSLMDKCKLDSFFASTDERLHAFASQALVFNGSVSHGKGSADE